MKINWSGYLYFCITDHSQDTEVCDSYDSVRVGYQPLKLKADIPVEILIKQDWLVSS